MTMNYKLHRLSNGIPVITEYIPYVRSVAFRMHINVGTRHEREHEHGLAHFLEHMMFKGTKKRNSFQIANEIERFGGNFNAYTSKEETVYYANTVDEQLLSTIDIFSDMLHASLFDEKHISQEKNVVKEEIQTSYDTPDDIIWDYFVENLLNPNSCSKPTLGTKQSVKSFSREIIQEFWLRHYHAGNILIGVVGNFNEEALMTALEEKFTHSPAYERNTHSFTPVDNKFDLRFSRDIQQSHIVMGKRVCDFKHDDRLNLVVLNNILGSGMSSRIFQNIREKYGFAYQVFSSADFYSDHGLLMTYIATDKKHEERSKELILKEIDTFIQGKISDKELEDAKLQIKGGILLSMESNGRRLERLMRHYLNYGEIHSIDEAIKRIEAITKEQIQTSAKNYLDTNQFASVTLSKKSA